jgi:hypothetical protein
MHYQYIRDKAGWELSHVIQVTCNESLFVLPCLLVLPKVDGD